MSTATAYFDESGTDVDSLDMCVAGYIFDADKVSNFEAAWQDMLCRYQLKYHHMREFRQPCGKGVYGHLDESRRDESMREAIDLIKHHAAAGVAIAVAKSVETDLLLGSIWENLYSFVAGQTIFGMRYWSARTGFDGEVSFMFEAGAQGVGQLLDAFQKIKKEPSLRADYPIGTVSKAQKHEAIALQAADMLAWHMRRYHNDLRAQNGRKRADFKELLKIPMEYRWYDESAVEKLKLIASLPPEETAYMDKALLARAARHPASRPLRQ